jgi:integrase
VVLSGDQIVRFLQAVPGLRNRAALTTAYGAGLRVCEVAALKVGDIDSSRMIIRVEHGKSLPPRRRGAARACPRESGGPLRHAVAAPPAHPSGLLAIG